MAEPCGDRASGLPARALPTSTNIEVEEPMRGPFAKSPPVELSVGEVAARTGLPVSTIHFYEAQGLVSSRRTSGNQRRFPRGVLRLISIIKVAQRTGIPLAAIRQALS